MRDYFDYHRSWVLLLTSVILILFAVIPLDNFLEEHYKEMAKDLSRQRDRLALQLQQWEKDNKKAVEISRTISKEEIKNLLAPANRDAFIASLEAEASKARLGAFHYILSPARPWDGGNDFPGIENVSISTLLIEAKAPHDGDAYKFIEALSKLDGKLALKEITLQPLDTDGPQKLGAYNLRVKASYEWFSNEVAR